MSNGGRLGWPVVALGCGDRGIEGRRAGPSCSDGTEAKDRVGAHFLRQRDDASGWGGTRTAPRDSGGRGTATGRLRA